MKKWLKNEYVLVGIILPIISGLILYLITEMMEDEPVIIIQNQPQPVSVVETPAPPLKFKINYLYRHKNSFEFKPLNKDVTLYSEDLYKIILTPIETSYVYIFQTDSKSNKIKQLFPLYKFQDVVLNHSNPVIAGTNYHIPKKGISFTLDNNSGTTETIYFIAAREPDIELEQRFKEIKISQQHDEIIQSKLETSKILEKITQNKSIIEPDNVPQTTRSELIEICDKCIKVLTFKHE